jgi:hypothetical protein
MIRILPNSIINTLTTSKALEEVLSHYPDSYLEAHRLWSCKSTQRKKIYIISKQLLGYSCNTCSLGKKKKKKERNPEKAQYKCISLLNWLKMK